MVKKFFKYSIVGVLGTIIDFSTLIIQVEILKFNIYLSILLSFMLAASVNHIINRNFTFKSTNPHIKQEYLKFILVSLVGVITNLCIIYILSDILRVHYIVSKILATSIVLLWNFLMNYHWTFNKSHANKF